MTPEPDAMPSMPRSLTAPGWGPHVRGVSPGRGRGRGRCPAQPPAQRQARLGVPARDSKKEQPMNVDRRLERLCDCVTLVHGLGDRSRARLCIMSLVASLAGEAHSDRPTSASPLIRSFGMPLNDIMPHGVRQRLKPFAPRILGTNDGCDRPRAEVLRRALAGEILPRIRGDFGVAQAAGRGGSSAEYLCIVVRRDLEARAAEVLEVLEGP